MPPDARSSRRAVTAARSRRRTRFRATADPTRRPTAYATRGGCEGSTPAENRSATGPRRCRGARARASKDARSRTRQIRPTGASGRARAGNAGPLALRASASGRGNRVSSSACGCSAGTCASTGLASSEEPRRTGAKDPRGRREEHSVPRSLPRRATRAVDVTAHPATGNPGDSPLSRQGLGGTFPRLAGLRPAAANFPGDPGDARLHPAVVVRGALSCPDRSPHLWTLLWTEEGGC
jgi:hypothetical protein